ncbi:hypothetical protein J8273_3233 [Carpediemonas membranifera]|uniref:Uncharacterized protein n=1 Tax=Carpediemonas membranifera TaxID=201153 RepID=A0A8J6B4Y2_9EUKA|nr:hypothetical protein J8273_3233 [Carpediemonas membranifera]|eukprot:KAG9393104.1 hypothetical protein J8273_3233 [Carpediemonas membranifera]
MSDDGDDTRSSYSSSGRAMADATGMGENSDPYANHFRSTPYDRSRTPSEHSQASSAPPPHLRHYPYLSEFPQPTRPGGMALPVWEDRQPSNISTITPPPQDIDDGRETERMGLTKGDLPAELKLMIGRGEELTKARALERMGVLTALFTLLQGLTSAYILAWTFIFADIPLSWLSAIAGIIISLIFGLIGGIPIAIVTVLGLVIKHTWGLPRVVLVTALYLLYGWFPSAVFAFLAVGVVALIGGPWDPRAVFIVASLTHGISWVVVSVVSLASWFIRNRLFAANPVLAAKARGSVGLVVAIFAMSMIGMTLSTMGTLLLTNVFLIALSLLGAGGVVVTRMATPVVVAITFIGICAAFSILSAVQFTRSRRRRLVEQATRAQIQSMDLI